ESDIDNFPCEDLRTIDQLWVKYSGGRFGFSVQAKIYRDLGGTREYNQRVWKAFGDRVGWRVNNSWIYHFDVTFDLKAPLGHLPVGLGGRRSGRGIGLLWLSRGGFRAVSSLASRLVKCNI
ncbi:GUN4 domain-containing protein, partial [Microcystis sp. LSC13-02]|uniref:GUN4 domain-containing protein n=1 Tax=Microcystis sp. LSC13-02 TaxID=1895004 RepID=UPI00257E37D5